MSENPIPIFTTKENKPPIAPVDATIAPSTDAVSITQKVASEYATNPVEVTPGGRKKRSDAGRPRGPRKNLADGSPQGQTGVVSPNGENVGYTIDKAIVEKTAKTILETVDGILVRKVGNTAIALGADNAFASELAKSSGLTQPEANLMAELTGIVFEKHGLLTGYAPEILLGILVTEWSIRVTLVMKRLTVMEKEQKRQKNVASPSPGENPNNREIR